MRYSAQMYHASSAPTRFPATHSKIDQLKLKATPMVMAFAIECWKPQKINKGTPSKIPIGEPLR